MRIIAGSARGRPVAVPGSGVRPTADRVRESLFSILETYVEDWEQERVLDVYAGSGALGLEARSRGAGSAVFVESDRRTAAVLESNCASLDLQGEVLRMPAGRLGRPSAPATLVFLDPPYALADSEVSEVLARLVHQGWLERGSLVVLERGSGDWHWPDGVSELSDRRYGATRVRIATFRPEGGSMATGDREGT